MRLSIKPIFRRLGSARAASVLAIAVSSIISSQPLRAQILQNEWSFNESSGSTAIDSINSSNITLVGGASLGGGTLTLPGGSGNYAKLPDGILSTFTNSMTIETWFTDTGGQTWARVWSFGGSTISASPNNANYIDLMPQAGNANNINGGFWAEFNHGNGATDAADSIPANSSADRSPVKTGIEEYATVVYDAPSQTARLYLNGVQVGKTTVAFRPSDLGFTRYNTLGLDQYNDSPFNGTVDELRLWQGAVCQRYISASMAAGPGVVINNLSPTSASLAAPPVVVLTGTEQAIVTVRLPQTGSTDLLATADATNWVSGNTSVLTVNSNGVISAVGLGITTVSATIAGTHVTSGNITVTPQTLQHEWSFNESGGTTAADSVGGANITLLGATSLGGGVLTLPGGSGNYASLPAGILSSNNSITIETWLTDNGGQTWARAWSFGGSVTVADDLIQNNYIDLIPKAGGPGGLWTEFKAGIPAITTEDVINAGNLALPTATEQCITVTYNAQNQTCIMYSNGAVAATLTGVTITPASLGNTLNNYLGKDEYNDSIFNGTFDEMRIWDGALTPVYALASAAAGPNVVITNTTPQSLSVSVASTTMLGSQTQQAAVQGSFLQVANVTLTTGVTNWASSNPNVLSVDKNGLITGVSGGTATVSATVNGVTAVSPMITVSSTAPAISQGPVNQTNVVGDRVSFGVQALGGGLTYQWALNTAPISGATNSILTLSNVNFTQAGIYNVLVSNSIATATASAVLTVIPPSLQHEWSFNESGGSTAFDSLSASNITLLGATSLGGGVLTLPGGAGNYAQLPNGMLSTYSNSITIETWFTDDGSLTWARTWSFGGSTAGPNNGFSHNNYIDLIPTAGNANGYNGGFWTEFNHNGNTDAVSSTPLPAGTEEYATVTYEVWDQTVRLYLNGAQVAVATNVTFTPADLGFTYNNFIGLDQYNDPIFNGTIDEMRIWDGAVTPLYQLAAAAAGPGVVITNATPQTLSLSANTSVLVGQTQQAVVDANFMQVASVPVTSLATNWLSSNPNIIIVNSSGFITAVSNGTAMVSATVNGVTGSTGLITVSPGAPVITQQPVDSETLLAGAVLRASVANIGSPPFTYYWFANNGTTPISVAGSSTLTVPNLQSINSGSYTCLISNQYGVVTSTPLNLTVTAPSTYQQAMLSLGPVGYWPLNEATGTNAYDLIGGHNGTYAGTYVLGQPGPGNGFFDGSDSALFDGTSGHVDIGGAPFNITNAVTVVAWVNLLSGPTFDGLVGHGDTSWRLSINPSGQPGGNVGDAQSDATDPIGSPGIDDGAWHMVAYSYTGVPGQSDNGSLYVDGVLVANNTVTTTPPGNNLDLWIGGSPDYGTRFLPAYIADAAVFTQSLSAAQVQGVFNGVAVLSPQNLAISRSGSNVVLSWQTGTLLEATNVLGPWTTNVAAAPGYTVPATNATKFFKLLVHP
jgi:uncharacterized protein YjdB